MSLVPMSPPSPTSNFSHCCVAQFLACSDAPQQRLYQFAKAAVTKSGGPSGLHNGNGLSHSSGGYKFQIKVLTGHAPSKGAREGLFPASLLAPGSSLAVAAELHLHVIFSLCAYICVQIFPFF